MKPKLPSLSREQKLCCKLSNSQINQIPKLRKAGNTLQEIATMFGVSKSTIWVWTLSPEKRAERYKKKHRNRSDDEIMRAKIASAKARKRKSKVLEKEYKTANAKLSQIHRDSTPEGAEKRNQYSRNYYAQNKSKWKKYKKKNSATTTA